MHALQGNEIVFINPATGERFGRLTMTSPEAVQRAREELRGAARRWAATAVAERVRLLRKLQAVIIDARDEISAVINEDCGKSRQDALIEVFITVDMLNEYCRHAEEWLAPYSVPRGLYLLKRVQVEHRPYGVVGVIAPWNYPFALSIPPAIAALLAGNAVMLKPSEVTAATGLMMERLFQRVPELTDYVRVLHGDASVGAALVNSTPDFIFLTGSTPTGKKVLSAAAEHLIPVTCELGGKDALLVLEDADVDAAARWAVWGACFNTGQTCMAVERVYVVEAVYEAFVAAAVRYTQDLKVGYSRDTDSPYYLGPMTFPRQVDIVTSHLQDALARGARILVGGGRKEMFIEPTVLVDVNHSMLLMQEETFGPLLPIMKVKDEAEGIRLANDNRYGLSASVWSSDHERALRVARAIEAGSVLVNDTICQFAVPMLPFGGVKQSGIGRVHGREGLMQFTQSQAYLVGEPPLAWDVATILRQPGHYQDAADIMRLAFGATLRQRLEPVVERLARLTGRLDRRTAATALGALGLAAVVLAVSRGRKS